MKIKLLNSFWNCPSCSSSPDLEFVLYYQLMKV